MRFTRVLSTTTLAVMLGSSAALAQSATGNSNPNTNCPAGSSASCSQDSGIIDPQDPNTGAGSSTEPDNSTGGGGDSDQLPTGGGNNSSGGSGSGNGSSGN
jgi:hypothetical protein